jgi:hypothetical protein
MKRIFPFTLLLVILLLDGCPARLVSPTAPYAAPESLVLKFDSRQWVLANKQSKPGYVLIEYLLPGETPSNFTESLGATYVAFDTAARLDSEAERLRKGVFSVCPGASWETVVQRSSEIVYIWQVRGCASQADQYEIGRFIASATGVHRVAYVIKTAALDPAVRQRWLQLIAQAQVVQNQGGP